MPAQCEYIEPPVPRRDATQGTGAVICGKGTLRADYRRLATATAKLRLRPIPAQCCKQALSRGNRVTPFGTAFQAEAFGLEAVPPGLHPSAPYWRPPDPGPPRPGALGQGLCPWRTCQGTAPGRWASLACPPTPALSPLMGESAGVGWGRAKAAEFG